MTSPFSLDTPAYTSGAPHVNIYSPTEGNARERTPTTESRQT